MGMVFKTMPNNRPFCNFHYLRTPMGAVKLANLIFGATSLTLVAVSYVPVWTLGVFIGTVTTCLFLSLLYLTVFMIASLRLLHSKANRVTCFIYHVLAGTALIVSGIELIGWSEYKPTCTHDCPRTYTVGFAKTLTFMNGVMYMIVGFLGLKDDDMLDAETASEADIPLLASTSLMSFASIPGAPSKHHHHSSHRRVSYDDVRSNYFNHRQHPSAPSADYSFNNSYSSSTYSHGKSNSHYGNMNGKSAGNMVMTMAYSMPAGAVDLHTIKE